METIPFGKAYTCWPIITEATYMLRKRQDQRDDLLLSVIAGDLILLRLRERDLAAVQGIFSKYHDQDIDLADACLLHLADREDIDKGATLDRRHFGMFCKPDGSPLTILPERSEARC